MENIQGLVLSEPVEGDIYSNIMAAMMSEAIILWTKVNLLIIDYTTLTKI